METTDEPDEFERLKAQVETLRAENDGKLAALQRGGVNIDGGAVLGVRFSVLENYLLPELWARPKTLDRYPRLSYELAVQERFREVIADVERQVRQATLTAGVQEQRASKLLRPGQ